MQHFNPNKRNRIMFDLSIHFHTVMRKLVDSNSISEVPTKILFILQVQQQTSLKTLCDILGVTASAGSILVDKCVKMGLVQRLPDPQDRRKVVLSLTKEGTELSNQCTNYLYHNMNEALTVLTEEENQEFFDALGIVNKYICKAFPHVQIAQKSSKNDQSSQ